MKLTVRLAVVVTALFAAVGVASGPAFATTCYTGGGDTQTFTISRCGTASIGFSFNKSGPCLTGHPEIWAYTTHTLHNYSEGIWCGGDGAATAPALWNERTCVEFWVPSGSNWVRYGSIICTSQ